MPPKATESTASSKSIELSINALCHIIAQQESLQIDKNAMATILGLTDGKNVPRKIDSIIKPYGWKFEHGKMIQIDAAAPMTPDNAGSKTTSGKSRAEPAKKTPGTSKGKKHNTSDEDGDRESAKKAKTKKAETPSKASMAEKVKTEPEEESGLKEDGEKDTGAEEA